MTGYQTRDLSKRCDQRLLPPVERSTLGHRHAPMSYRDRQSAQVIFLTNQGFELSPNPSPYSGSLIIKRSCNRRLQEHQ